jgi:PAS domain S-box-containing protein
MSSNMDKQTETKRHHIDLPEGLNDLLLINNALVMAISSIEEGTFLEVNDCFLKLLHLERSDVIGKTSSELGITFDKNRDEIVGALENGDGIHNLDVLIERKGENEVWIRYFADIVKIDGVPRLFSVGLDVTKEKKALLLVEERNQRLQEAEIQRKKDQEELELREKHLRSLVDNPSGYIVYRTRLNPKTGQIDVVHVSPSFTDVLGVSEQDRNNFQQWFAYVVPEDLPLLMAANEAGMHPPFKFSQVIRYMHPQQGLRWLDVRATGIPFANNPELIEYANGIILDITELKKKEVELQKALERANESDALKSAFLANLSHEIRTPMNGIMGFSDLLQQPDISGKEQEQYLRIIQQSGERMLNTLNNLINISKIEAGQEQVNLVPVNINAQMEQMYDFFAPMAKQKKLEFTMECPLYFADAVVTTDREKLLVILSNLLKNALKYTREGSVSFGYDLKDDVLEFFIKDTGIGIPGDRKEAIFDRFVQADIEDKEVLEGAGLGLSIADAYTEMLGGKIWVDSEIGKGSTFYYTIPYRKAGSKASEIASVHSEKDWTIDRKFVVLIAEDEASSELYLDVLMKDHAQKIFHARDGATAVELFKNHPEIDLIFMDIKLPITNGYEATRKIREINPTVPVIAQTAYALKGDREKAMEAGCNAYLSKPIRKELLFKLLKQFEG